MLSAPPAPVVLVDELVAPIVLLLLDVSEALLLGEDVDAPAARDGSEAVLELDETEPRLERPAVLLAGDEL